MNKPHNETFQVFLCHSSEDKIPVRTLYERLILDGISAWLDEKSLLPGQDWKVEIPIAIQKSQAVVVCLSKNSITREGYIHQEIKVALDVADKKPEGTIYIIPVKLEDCEVPQRLQRWQWVNLAEINGYDRLLEAFNIRSKEIEINLSNISNKSEESRNESKMRVAINPYFQENNGNNEKLGRTRIINTIICYYCGTVIKNKDVVRTCPECGELLPSLYAKNISKYPPVFLNIIGERGHGKTIYLNALNWCLTVLSRYVDQFSYSAVDDNSLRFQDNSWNLYKTGSLASATPKSFAKPTVFHLSNLSMYGNRALIINDSAGEIYRDDVFQTERYQPFVTKCPTTIAMISLTETDGHYRIDRLLSGLLNTYAKNNPKSINQQKNVIIALSKGDAINKRNVPSLIHDYLMSDPLSQEINELPNKKNINVNVATYLREMSEISKYIQEWLVESNLFAKNMVALAKNNNVNLEFTLISSLGYQPFDGKLTAAPRPYRVLDPLFWLLEFTSNQKR